MDNLEDFRSEKVPRSQMPCANLVWYEWYWHWLRCTMMYTLRSNADESESLRPRDLWTLVVRREIQPGEAQEDLGLRLLCRRRARPARIQGTLEDIKTFQRSKQSRIVLSSFTLFEYFWYFWIFPSCTVKITVKWASWLHLTHSCPKIKKIREDSMLTKCGMCKILTKLSVWTWLGKSIGIRFSPQRIRQWHQPCGGLRDTVTPLHFVLWAAGTQSS